MRRCKNTVLITLTTLLCGCGGPPEDRGFCGPPQTIDRYLAFVANNTDGTGNVSAFAIDRTSGALQPVRIFPFPAGANPTSIVTAAPALFAYAANSGSGNISAYRVDSLGFLSNVAGSPFSAGTGMPRALAVAGYLLYVARSTSDQIGSFRINPDTGALTALGSAAAGTDPVSITVSGNYVYTANAGSNDISAYSTDYASGALSSIGPSIPAGTTPQAILTDVTQRFIYVANTGSNNISGYSIDSSNGTLTNFGTAPAGSAPTAIATAPNGRFLYVANFGSNDISAYRINTTTGVLTPLGSPIPAGSQPRSLSVEPQGQYLYVANFGAASISRYSIDPASGGLTSLGAIASDANPFAITTTVRRSVSIPC